MGREGNKRKRGGRNVALCPVCGRACDFRTQRTLTYVKVPRFATSADLWKAIQEGSVSDSHSDRRNIHWACDQCLEHGRALKADVTHQTFCDSWPYYAYYDEPMECPDCHQSFLFTKEEKRHWYEALGFWVQSRPKYCKPCKAKRKSAGRKAPQPPEPKP